MPQSRKAVFFCLFFLSGFSGLIYESIWSHYLKLFLGHAAYAQTLVLAIFMGGMALGSLLSGLLIQRWRALLLGYAIVEAIVGVLAISFHPIFINVTDVTFTHLISGMGDSPAKVIMIKWGIASLLIFPQSVLLGMTFPLMVGGILRHFPAKPGYTLSMLYFTNSFGAVFGVLASSFVFIDKFGLPGTMLTAGLLNIALAFLVWSLAKAHPDPEVREPAAVNTDTAQDKQPVLPGVLLLIALLTGLSSFMYEIGWIRMLVLVLGGSTHSFELMLASFILGLALGGLWIRNRIDKIKDSRSFLGYVQIAMAVSAILSIWLYHYSFDMMSFIYSSIQRKDSTYPWFLFLSGLISVSIMLPATFCAGMTLPLITRLIIQSRSREKGIGYVYSANTLGAIVGIFLSVHVVMPALGLKNLIGIGAVIDLILGLYLIGFLSSKRSQMPRVGNLAAASALFVVGFSIIVVDFDLGRLSSGVFRYGRVDFDTEVIYHKDGKTSTVTVAESPIDGIRIIKNNGKPDASVSMDASKPHAPDEETQVLLSAIPLLHKPEAKSAAIIGMGSGMSTHTMLGSAKIESVDTIEMEAKVIEGSRLFLPVVDRAYNDPRSELYVEDAKTFFSTHKKQYDIIVSEPPNPWVSGVATLFSQEFYQRIKKHISPEGVFVQWIHLYEIDLKLIATIFNALGSEFEDYIVYRGGTGDIIIVASVNSVVPELGSQAFGYVDLKSMLTRVQINKLADVEWNRVGTKQILQPLFSHITASVNSDFFPILDGGAPRTRFTGVQASSLTGLINSSIPAVRFLDRNGKKHSLVDTENPSDGSVGEKKKLLNLINEIVSGSEGTGEVEPTALSDSALVLRYSLSKCGYGSEHTAEKSLTELGFRVVSQLSFEEQKPLWDYLKKTECISGPKRNDALAGWHALFAAANNDDYAAMSEQSTLLLKMEKYNGNQKSLSYLMSIGLLGDMMRGDKQAAVNRWDTWGGNFADGQVFLPLRLILSNIGIQI